MSVKIALLLEGHFIHFGDQRENYKAMGKEILELLKEMQKGIKKMDNRLSNFEERQKIIEKKIDKIEEVTQVNCYEIVKLSKIDMKMGLVPK